MKMIKEGHILSVKGQEFVVIQATYYPTTRLGEVPLPNELVLKGVKDDN